MFLYACTLWCYWIYIKAQNRAQITLRTCQVPTSILVWIGFYATEFMQKQGISIVFLHPAYSSKWLNWHPSSIVLNSFVSHKKPWELMAPLRGENLRCKPWKMQIGKGMNPLTQAQELVETAVPNRGGRKSRLLYMNFRRKTERFKLAERAQSFWIVE